jgi:tRNA(Ile2) C34 agmatinyltransferase TiaS
MIMGWIGLDDTDTLAGGCTTLVFHQLLEGLPSNIAVSEARLVRLWPFAKKRTRGNAAMAAELILLDDDANVIVDEERKDIATKSLLQHLDEWWNEHIAPLEGAVEQSTHNDRPQVPTEPGMVWFETQPDDSFYRMAVSENVEMEQVPIADRAWGSHGIIGATAAVSWPAQTVTWETIAWRDDCTSAREICERTLSVIDSWQGTFMSRDSRKGRSLIAPRGNCPVLFGVRARDKKTANNAAKKLLDSDSTQPSIGMRAFLTNQASDDHLGEIYIGKVISTKILSRGHVIITVQQNVVDDSNAEDEIAVEENTWMAFAQSGDIKNLAQWFQTGDVIKGRGLVAEDGAIHLEKLKLVEASERNKRRPPCERCGKTVKSQGKNNKLRCPACKNLQENIWIYNPQNPPHRGWVQPPVDHRRHLSRPLKWDQE